MMGAGKYDEQCTRVREETGGQIVMVMVLGGKEGHGFSVQADTAEAEQQFPGLLRTVASLIERDLHRKSN